MIEVTRIDSQEINSRINLNKFANKSIMIVGSNGLIGYNIIQALDFHNKKEKSKNSDCGNST